MVIYVANPLYDSVFKYAIPMVAIYLLGHCIGQVKEPVVYVNH